MENNDRQQHLENCQEFYREVCELGTRYCSHVAIAVLPSIIIDVLRAGEREDRHEKFNLIVQAVLQELFNEEAE